MDKDRYKTTQEISSKIWKIYKERLESMRADEMWWDETVVTFNSFAATYKNTTHEKYVFRYALACLEDLETVYKELTS